MRAVPPWRFLAHLALLSLISIGLLSAFSLAAATEVVIEQRVFTSDETKVFVATNEPGVVW